MKIDKTNFIIVVTALFMICASALVIAAENRGGETLKVDGGSKGIVTFPHKEHQDQLKDCNICHSLFAQESGIIKNLKEKKELKGKQVMNDLCIKCHKDYKASGKTSGPTTCSGCHTK